MSRPGTLQRRVTRVFALTGLLVAVVVSVSTFMLAERYDDYEIQSLIHIEMQRLLEADTRGTYQAKPLASFLNDNPRPHPRLPADLHELDNGLHWLEQRQPPVVVMIQADDARHRAVVYDLAEEKLREIQLMGLLIIQAMLIVLVTTLCGHWLGRRALGPVRKLARAVANLDPESERPGDIDVRRYPADEVGELAEDVARYHRRLIELLNHQRRFASFASHELRTPLTGLRSSLELLSERLTTDQTREQELVARMQRSLSNMEELIEFFIALRKQHLLPHQHTDRLETVVRKTIEAEQPWLMDRQVETEVTVISDGPVAVDERILTVILCNLLRNAFQHGTAGRIGIRLAHGEIRIENRVSPKARHPEPGIGLEIVRTLAEAAGLTFHQASHSGKHINRATLLLPRA
ncbi:HAMP domain-containing sensor histidine kinase [Gammaproteobacteria bacterium AB-CW1]|uniref:histidine kinase n=1 Tax=Natronospira elongata TaxID=3110268 RepID=A0AAP6JGF4_9GAMM|nr:HAMP domain-containing sensor histidine kinase [Gammaproteobacteria bacterium AB-CW1]